MTDYTVAALYLFAPFPDFAAHRARLKALCDKEAVKGILLLAHEGINGTIAGPPGGVTAVIDAIRSIPGFAALEPKYAEAEENPFYRMKVRLKSEIVTLGRPEADPLAATGTYVAPEDWNEFITRPDVTVIDTRNDYEVRVGTFKGALNPRIETFREFPGWFESFHAARPNTKYAMFCTGGIRCEKSTALLKAMGIDEVYHLKGGILKYLETVPETESLWEGECFVFDQRVTVAHGLATGSYDLCHACRMPVSEADKAAPEFVEGVSCPHCHDKFSAERKQRFAERQRQIKLARERGEAHLGAAVTDAPSGGRGPR